MAENHVEIEGLAFSYGDLEIFRGLSLAIPRGKVVAILGGSGSGKSTLLKLIGGQLKPSRGRIMVAGKNVPELAPRELYRLRLGMGMMFQTSGLFSDLSVYDNVAFPIAENFRLPDDITRRMVLMKLHAVGLRGAKHMRPGDLSGGMTRRVALARAIATDPNLAMYDEPFAGLDPISLGTAARLIRQLNDTLGLTSIVVSHDLDETFRIADHVIILANGGIAAQGTPQEVRGSIDPLVHQFVNALPDGPVHFHYPAVGVEDDFGNANGGRR
jgi:phospholipid/cholesterol/gamma-HCH transport system ATP-binding protein